LPRFIYVDNAATTKVSKEVLTSMLPYFNEFYGNPSSLYKLGRESKKAIEQARESISKILKVKFNEIFFTSGGSEANNWAIKGIALNLIKKNKRHIITSSFEHHSVLHAVKFLEKHGFQVTYLDVNKNGIIKPEDFKKAIKPETGFASIMYANNEIGTIQPIDELSKICKENKIIFHTDAVQAIGSIRIDFKNIDLLSLSAHKIHGPKGIGILYIKKGIEINNLIDGGAQERNKRAGTENVPGIVGFNTALKEVYKNLEENNKKLIYLRDKLINNLLKIDKSVINGDLKNRLPGNINMCFKGVEGESLLLKLDFQGICASSGSACTSGSLDPSHVLLAIGLPHEVAHGSLRLSLNKYNTEEDVNYILEKLPKIIKELRDMSPLWEKIVKSEGNL